MKPGPFGPYPYRPITQRPRLTWPGGARLALWVIPNIEVFGLNEMGAPVPDVREFSVREYGARVGIFRQMEVLSRHRIRATVALNSEVCDAYPQIIEAGRDLDWEFMGHNQSNTRRLNQVPADQEPAVIRASLDRIEAASGVRPAGWLGSGLQETWNTLDYLAQEGVEYVADWVNDDQPYRMQLGTQALVSIPYSMEINDKPAIEGHHRSAEEFERMICRQFDVLYKEGQTSGRVMAIALHPYITGVPHRIGALDAALSYICRHEGVWLATGQEIVHHFLSQPEPS